MANYSFPWTATNTQSTTVPIANLYQPAAALKRLKLYEVNHSSAAAPADNAGLMYINRATTVPTGGTAVTPAQLDLADGAASALAMEAATGGSTLTAGLIMLQIAFNQRATQRWVAKDGGEIVVPSTNNVGLATVPFATGGTAFVIYGQYYYME